MTRHEAEKLLIQSGLIFVTMALVSDGWRQLVASIALLTAIQMEDR